MPLKFVLKKIEKILKKYFGPVFLALILEFTSNLLSIVNE